MNKTTLKTSMILLLMSVLGIVTMVNFAQNGENKVDDFDDNLNITRIFRLVNSLNKEAEKQQANGFEKRAEMLKNYFQKKTGISDEANLKLKELAAKFQKESERLNAEIKEFRKNQKNKPNDAALASELAKLRESRNKLFADSRQSLSNDMAKDDSEKVLKFLREKVIGKSQKIDKSRLKKSFKKTEELNWFSKISYNEASVFESEIEGYSLIDYDPIAGEIFAMAVTEGRCEVGGDGEHYFDCDSALVYSEIKNELQEVLAEADAYDAGDSTSVEFYATEFNGQPLWNGQYCIYSQHGIEPGDYSLITAESSECVDVEIPETPTIDILWNGNSIKNTTQEAVVGQKIELSVAVTGGTPTNQQWTIDGEKVKDYKINIVDGKAVSAEKTNLESQHLSQSSVQFYWVDGGEGRQIQVTANVNGTPYSATATFNVKRLVVSVTTTTGSTTIYTVEQHQELVFGSIPFSVEGIRFFRNSFQLPTGYSGDTYWLQTINYTSKRTLSDGQTVQTASGIGLDDLFPYSSFDPNSGSTADSPGFCLRVCGDAPSISKLEVQISAEMWLMFKPKNLPNGEESIYVPLKKVNWNWSAIATRGSDFLFTLTNSSNTQNPIAEDTTNFPIWSIIVTGQEPYQ